jgi:plastocyanin
VRTALFGLVLLSALITAAGGVTPLASAPPPTLPPAEATVEISGYACAPSSVNADQTVRWSSSDLPLQTVTRDPKDWASQQLKEGESCTRTFEAPMTFPSLCANHYAAMQGVVGVR